MEHSEAVALIREGVVERGGTWADLGAGSGTFSRALAELIGPDGLVYAVDRRTRPLAQAASSSHARIEPLDGDFTRALDLPQLDGILMANALHFVRTQELLMRRLAAQLGPKGSFVLVEYDIARGTPWVPFPIPPKRFTELVVSAGLREPRVIGHRRSRFGPQELYAAITRKD